MSHFEAHIVEGGLKLEDRGFHNMQIFKHTFVLGIELLFGLGEGLSDLISVTGKRLLIRFRFHLKQLKLLF